MKIEGKGKIPAGQYDIIEIDGNAHLLGEVTCGALSAEGRVRGASLACTGEAVLRGRASFSGGLAATELRTLGTLTCGALAAREALVAAGEVRIRGSLTGGDISALGTLAVGGEVTVGVFTLVGRAELAGQLSAPRVEIAFARGGELEAVKGEEIEIRPRHVRGLLGKIPPVRRLLAATRGILSVHTSIEGDAVRLDRVRCPEVTGRTVTLGDGCSVDLVRYREEITVAKGARVGRVEKIEWKK